MGGFQVGMGGFSSAWVVCGCGANMARTRFVASRILRCRPTEEEEESLANDGEEEELRRTWQRALTSFALIRISI